MSSPGFSEAPTRAEPPPPPPPPVPGQVPALRISTTAELGAARRGPQDAYEPPAAIQNAMMTKDKKPFTYTPGMGGKLDLSQIRSPRMARRVAKNANDEGVEGPPKSALAQEPRSPTSNIYSHPPVAVPVFPQQQPVGNLRSTLPRSPPVIERVEPAPKPVVKVETKIVPMVNSQETPSTPSTPSSPTSPTQVTLAKAPTPWMQKQVKQQEQLPEWAKRSNSRSQDPEPQERVVQIERVPPPPRIEDRPSIFSAMNEPGHHQLMNTTPHHQSRWGNPVGMSCPPSQQPGATYIVPVQVSPQNQYQTVGAKLTPVDSQNNRSLPRPYTNQNQQAEPGPVQSKSFRVLQKITDTDPDQVDTEQLRKLQLTEDDRCLMNKFKEQVDGDTYLHQEEDPRYRGAAIPSRAFRYLQNITDSGEQYPSANNTPRPVNSVVRNQNRNSKTFDEPPVYLPPSEQQAPEPKKYMGGAIPSRSFRILQAMTAPESIATQVKQENREDFVSIPVNRQVIHCLTYPRQPFPTSLSTLWKHERGWCASYDVCDSYNFYYPPEILRNGVPDINDYSRYYICSNNSGSNSVNACTASYCNTNLQSENYALYVGPSTSTITINAEPPDDNVPRESDSLEDKSESSCSSKSNEETSSQSSESSCDSDSYLAYSTGLNPLKKQQFHKQLEASAEANDNNSTDCDQQDIDDEEDDLSDEKQEEQEELKKNGEEEGDEWEGTDEVIVEQVKESQPKKNEVMDEEKEEAEEEDNDEEEEEKEEPEKDVGKEEETTVSVRLPLRLNRQKKITIETCVDFTLKRPNSQENPKFVVTSMENVNEEVKETDESKKDSDSPVPQTKRLLNVPRENSREEITDDEDSGVTSDMSRIISEVDTDSECVLRKPRNQNKKYQRTQTHSRLFRLLSSEQLKVPTQEGNSSNSSGLTSPDCSLTQECTLFPTRPKSLDCEALFKRYREKQQDDFYYQTWKNGQPDQRQRKSEQGQSSVFPRVNVLCPRVKSARNLSQSRKSLHGSPNNNTTATVSSNLIIPPSIRTNRRC